MYSRAQSISSRINTIVNKDLKVNHKTHCERHKIQVGQGTANVFQEDQDIGIGVNHAGINGRNDHTT